jgi:hypothetical protein
MTRGSPNRGAGALLEGGVRRPRKGWAGKETALADALSIQQPPVGVTGLGRDFGQMLQPVQAAQVGGFSRPSRSATHGRP